MTTIYRRSMLLLPVLLLVMAAPKTADATIVEFRTSLGDFQVNLYDNLTPATVDNFLEYVNSGAYTQSVVHRSAPNFVLQGGGFNIDMANLLQAITTIPAVTNEPELSNVRGTIAMAKLGGDPNSATSQWFFNTVDNASALDDNNGGFTVFGEVIGDGMDVVNAIAGLPTFQFDSPFGELPLRDYSQNDFTTGVNPDDTNFVIISEVIIADSDADSAAGLNPPANTAGSGIGGGGGGSSSGGGGGASGLLWLAGLLLMAWRRDPAFRG